MLDTFDIVIEVSRKKLLSYILEQVRLQSLPIVPKFILKVSGQKGSLQAILDTVDLNLSVGANQATLVYHVYAATVQLANQAQIGFSDGEVQIKLKFTPGAPLKAVLQSAQFQTSQTSQIPDPNAFFADVNSLLTGILDTQTEWDLFPNTPNQTKLLMLGLALNGQISCLDPETVVAVMGQGNLSKVTNFLKKQDFGVALSVDRVKNSLLFPSETTLLDPQEVANFLGITLVEAKDALQNPSLGFINSIKPILPAPFGSGSAKQTVQGVDLFFDFIDFALTNGAIKMAGKFHGEAFCSHIHNGAFDENISLSIVNQQILATFTPNPPKPVYSVELDFWCALGFLFLASNVALVTGIVVTSILMSVATSITVQQKQLSQNPFSAPAFDQVTWQAVQIFTEGLVLLGKSSAAVGYNTNLSGIDISVNWSETNVEHVGTGIYHFPGTQVCKAQDFQYEEFRQDLVLTFFPKTTGLLFPVKTTWIVHGQAITNSSGQINYSDLAHTATPPFNESVLPNHHITIDYILNPGTIISVKSNGLSTLQLTFPKSDYNFGLFIELKIQDASGHSYSRPLALEIETDILEFGQDFIDFQKQCGLATKIQLSKIKTIPQTVLHDGDPLTVEQVAQIVKEAINEQPLQAVDIMKSLNTAYGSRAILKAFSPPANLRARIKG